jgi:PAS domain S-box-containing protein
LDPGSDEAFQKLLLRIATAANQPSDANSLIQFFCRSTRESFQVSGVCFWRYQSQHEFLGEQADGKQADRFMGMRLRTHQGSVMAEAVRQRRTVFVNGVSSKTFARTEPFEAGSLMVAPVVAFTEVIGAVTFLQDSETNFFNEDLAAKATILAGQLGSLLEARRRNAAPVQEQSKAEILADITQALQGTPDVSSVIEALADRLRLVLRTRLVCVLLRRDGPFELRAISAETPQLANAVRARHDRQTIRFAADLAQRAASAGEPITFSIGADVHFLGKLISPGTLIAAPFRTVRTQGAILVYPRQDGIFSAEEKALVAALAGFGAVAVAHAELHATAHAQAHELQQLLEISNQQRHRAEALIELAREIDGVLHLPDFVSKFVVRAAALTGVQCAVLALFQDGHLQITAKHAISPAGSLPAEGPGKHSQAEVHIAEVGSKEKGYVELSPDPALDRLLASALRDCAARHPETVISGAARDLLGHEVASALQWNDCTIVRLSGSKGDLAGLLCLSGRSQEWAEDARAFVEAMATHAAMTLENARLFTRMEQSNRHWLQIFDAISDFIVVHDEAHKVLRVNRSLASLVGVPPAELIGLDMRSLLAADSDLVPYGCPFCRSMAGEQDEFVHPLLDRTYLVSTSRIGGSAGEPAQTIHVLKDTTDRREAELRYRELFDNVQEGLFFSTMEGRFIEVNDAMVRMLGYSTREELLQVDIPAQIYFSPEQRQHHAQVLTQTGSLRNFEATLRRKDGSPVHVLINAFGLYDHQGKLLQIRGLMLDVTGLRNYQSELHRERDFSSKILDNTQSLILVADTAGLISYANRRWCDAGFEQRDLLGRPLIALAAPGFARPLADALGNTLSGQQVDNLELQILRKHEPPGQFSANLSPMRDEHGAVTSIVVVLTDITDAAVLRGKLIHTEKMAAVGQLVSGVAHEVNNPLTAILGFADLMMENPQLPAAARKDLRVILQEAERTKQIVQNLLSFARQMPPQRQAVQVNSILRRTIQLRSYDFTSHGVEVIEHFDQGLPEVIGDSQQLQQVFLNILNNAYDAVHQMNRPARIEITTMTTGDAIEISFCDNGDGISHPDRIFDPFFTTKEVGKGTGLGLSICYGIVKEHGGEILFRNNSDGPGATFIVRLPSISNSASLGVAAGVMQK